MAKKEVFFQVLWFSCRKIRWGRRPKWNFHLDNLASPWYFFNVAVRFSPGWISFSFRWELVLPYSYSPFCIWGCEVTALDFVTEICNTTKQISKALVGEVILISMSRFGKVHFIQTLPFIYVECLLCSAYCVHSLLLRQICIQACHIHWNQYNVFYDFCCCAILGFHVTSRAFPNLVVGHVGVPSDREICDNSMSDLATLSFSSKFCGRKWNYRTEKAIRTQIGPVRVSLIFPSSPKASRAK